MKPETVVIVGAGQAAAAAALRLRANGHTDPILILGDENHPPYQRPPLSKRQLAGSQSFDSLYIRPAAFWRDAGIELRTGTKVEKIDPARRELKAGGRTYAWDRLVIATGSKARPLPQPFVGRSNVFELRSIADVERLAPGIRPGRSLVVIGGGFVGLEVAAAARRLGMEVTVLERAGRILERAVCAETSGHIRDLHLRNGVRILEANAVTGVSGHERIATLSTDAGHTIPADIVLVGIGVTGETALARDAGLTVDDGIVVDTRGRTSLPGIWAAGDCTSFPFRGELTRLENVQNAIEQAETVADDICGRPAEYSPVPWFWSDQYDSKLQMAGLARGHDAIVSRRGERGGLSCWYFDRQRLVAVEAVDDARAYMTGRKLIERNASPPIPMVADPACDLKALLAA